MGSPVIEKVVPGIYRVEIPLPQNPLKATNSYIIKAEKRNLIIDTGMNREECMSAMTAALQQLEVSLQDTDFFITHLHADHSGLVSELASDSSVVYFNQPDADVINNLDFWREIYLVAIKHGFTEDELSSAIEKHPGVKYSSRNTVDLTIVRDGDPVTVGDFNFKCLETPGHTRGHMCLYEESLNLFISGDHILGDITPNISLWDDVGNPLLDYYKSLDKVYGMEIDLVLPGHRSIIKDCRSRINELKDHHSIRLEEVGRILKSNPGLSAYQVASKMHWDIVAANWEAFPLMQKWFATGEALAHIKYLEEENNVLRKEVNGGFLFFNA